MAHNLYSDTRVKKQGPEGARSAGDWEALRQVAVAAW